MTTSDGHEKDEKELASSQRDKILRFLRELHPREMRVFDLCEAIIAEPMRGRVTDDPDDEDREGEPIEDYSSYPSAPYAILAYLRTHGPTSRKRATSEIVRGGYGKHATGKNKEQRLADVRSAITYQISKAVQPLIREQNKILYVVEEEATEPIADVC